MKKKIILKLLQLLFGVLIICLSINIIESLRHMYRLKKVNNVSNYAKSYIEVNDMIEKRNKNFQSRICGFEDFFQCLSGVDNDLSRIFFDGDGNQTVLVISPDSIIVKYKIDESLTNKIAMKILGVRIDCPNCNGNIFELAAFSNIIDRMDTVVFFVKKRMGTNENILDTIRGIVQQEVKLFLNKNSNYYLHGNWLYIAFEYSPQTHKYMYEVSNEIDYTQELLMVNIRASLHDFMFSRGIWKAVVRIQVPVYSPIPPP